MNRTIPVLAVLGAAISLGACSGGPDEPPVPDGFVRYRGGGVSFVHPAGWRPVRTTDERNRPVLDVNGPELPSGLYDGQVHLERVPGWRRGLGVQVRQFRGAALLNGYTVTADRAARVEGAAAARRIEATYAADGASGKVPFRMLGLFVLTRDHVLRGFILRSPVSGSANADLARIYESFRLIKE
ncbi:hypothetical protein [Actinomadura atramentaria]|uniref:hypothetical protein n=1 Tax=Actinomadura atramentaria TaxID=1990 RepID=UPI0003A69AC1|nr:hypothetical protein [Actinomadura atramentaria]